MPSPLDACNPNLNATVSASAGSGKTWLLITRIVRLLLDGAEPGNIIALTFTRKAAGEMQIRLNERLFEMATLDDTGLDELFSMIGCEANQQNRIAARGLYEKLLHSLYPIRIQTFHSFCQDILSRFPLEADIPPAFELLEDSSLLQRQALQALFDLAAQTPASAASKQLSAALDVIMRACNGPDNTRTALDSFLSHRSDWWAYTAGQKDPVAFARQQLAALLRLHEDGDGDPVGAFLNDINRHKLKVFANLLREIKLKTGLLHADSIDAALDKEVEVRDAIFSLLRSAFLTLKGEPMSQGRSYSKALEKKLGADDAQRFVDLHAELAAAIQSIAETRKRRFSYTINEAWYLAGAHYTEIFQRLKRQMRLLDFTDLEWKCYQLLQQADNAHWVQYKIDQRIDHLLIDEFQDTNPTQWHLLSPILEEIAANPEERQRSIFLVGDEKQSIYSFRRANPALQAQASSWLAQHLDARATPLDFSRRSSPAIIDCVNRIFEQDAVQAIMPGYTTHGTHLQDLPGQVTLCDLFEQEDSDDGSEETVPVFRNPLLQAREISQRTLRHEEADYIARQIRQLVDARQAVNEGSKSRAIDYGDILILLRNRTHVEIYESALKAQGIPFIGSKKGGLLDNLEIRDLSCLLNTLITPFDNLALAQVLKSPIFDASDEDLITLARCNPRTTQHWYQRLLILTSTTDTATPVTISKALKRAAQLLPRWQKLAEQLPVHDCLDRIFSEGNIINRFIAASRPENRSRVAVNCQRFLELSLETDSGRYPGISRFLQQLDHLKNHSENPPQEPLSQGNESRVRLMTIHGSKGLEAPIVFLADCNSTAKNKNAYSSLVRWPAAQPRPVNFQLQLNKDNTDNITGQLQQARLDEQAREELNLLYVALTRARQQLFISGVASRSRQSDSWYQTISNGLADIEAGETGIAGITGKRYQYRTDEQQEAPITQIAKHGHDTPAEFDERLARPLPGVPAAPFMIAPSLHSHGETFYHTADDAFEDEQARWRGILIHRMLEQLCNIAEYPATDVTAERLKQRLKNELTASNTDVVQLLDDCEREAVATYNQPSLAMVFDPQAADTAYNEMPLMYMDGEQAVYGIIDRVLRTRDSTIVIDYKSHRLKNAAQAENIATQFDEQLAYYSRGVQKLWPGHAVKKGIIFTQLQKIIWLDQAAHKKSMV